MVLIVVNWRVDGLKSGGEFDRENMRVILPSFDREVAEKMRLILASFDREVAEKMRIILASFD